MPFILAAALLQASTAAPAPPAPTCAAQLCVETRDLVPRFLAFWDAAQAAPPADAEARFQLWRRAYGFAAVPPGPQGEPMARRLLDTAWPRYPAAVPALRRLPPPDAGALLTRLQGVARLLDYRGSLTVRSVRFVGGFEDNAFAYAIGPTYVVNFPAEAGGDPAIAEAHEFAHAVHLRIAGLPGGWERSIAQTALTEGLAMHVSRALAPGRPVPAYITHDPAWWPRAQARRAAIVADVAAVLDARDAATVRRFTVETGPAGLNREAYAAGWWMVERLRADGMTLAQIARVPEAELVPLARRALTEMAASR